MEKLTTFVVNIILGIIRFMRPVTDKIAVFFASLGKTIDPNRAGMALGFAIVAFSIWLFYVLSLFFCKKNSRQYDRSCLVKKMTEIIYKLLVILNLIKQCV